VPRASVIDLRAVEERLPQRASVNITGVTAREKCVTRNHGSLDLPRDDLDALLRGWWAQEPGAAPSTASA
jgi:hypothetical protein